MSGRNNQKNFSRTVLLLIFIIGISIAAAAITKIYLKKKYLSLEEIQEKEKTQKPAPVKISEPNPSPQIKTKNKKISSYNNSHLPSANPSQNEQTVTSKSTIKPEDIKKITQRIEQYLNKKNYKRAVEALEKLNIQNPVYKLYLGVVQYHQRKFIKSVKNITRSLDSPHNNKDRFMGEKYLALTYYQMNRLEQSHEHLLKALKIKSDKQLNWLKNKIAREKRSMRRYGDSSSEHFNIVFSKEEHDEIRLWIRDILEEAYREIGKGLGYHPDSGLTVILYNEKNFFDVTRAPGWAGGLYDGKIRLPVRGLTRANANLKRIIFHEYTHALIHKITLKCPLWLNEGLAEYFSIGDVKQIPQYIPLNLLEKRFPQSPPKVVYIAYRQSYTAVKRLEDRFGMHRIRDLLNELSEGTPFTEAFEDIFMISYKKFMETWKDEG